jgi:hypothetical protein
MTDSNMPAERRADLKGGHRIHVIKNFITPEDAQTLIDEQRNPSSTNPYPEYYKKRFGGTSFPYNDRVMDILKKYGEKANEVHKEQNAFYNDIYVFKAFGSWWTEGTKGGLHIDAQDPEPFIEWSTIIYLNGNLNPQEEEDGQTISPDLEFTGGRIYFPNQNYVYEPRRYSAVFFPSAGTEYIHGITKVLSGNRHTALYMHTSLPTHADPDFIKPGVVPKWKAMGYPLNDE